MFKLITYLCMQAAVFNGFIILILALYATVFRCNTQSPLNADYCQR